MTIDPREYDLGELRSPGGRPSRTRAPEDDRPADRGPDQSREASFADRRFAKTASTAPADRPSVRDGGFEPAVVRHRLHKPSTAGGPDADPAPDRELARLQRLVPAASRPYVSSIPSSYDAEQIIIDWLEPLVAATGVRGALAALSFYESIGWIDTDAKETLTEYVRLVADPQHDEHEQQADMRHHRRSLTYIARLAAL